MRGFCCFTRICAEIRFPGIHQYRQSGWQRNLYVKFTDADLIDNADIPASHGADDVQLHANYYCVVIAADGAGYAVFAAESGIARIGAVSDFFYHVSGNR